MSAYKKHTWAEGEEITDDKLNNLETGVNDALKNHSVVMPEQTLTDWTNGTYYQGPVECIGGLIPGEFYAVTLDGVKYICKCNTRFEYEGAIITGPHLGTLTDTEPFLLAMDAEESAFFLLNAADTHTLSVKLYQFFDVEQLNVTDDDEGKFLSVVNGKPAWVSLS